MTGERSSILVTPPATRYVPRVAPFSKSIIRQISPNDGDLIDLPDILSDLEVDETSPPAWARTPQLVKALQRQEGQDVEEIFGHFGKKVDYVRRGTDSVSMRSTDSDTGSDMPSPPVRHVQTPSACSPNATRPSSTPLPSPTPTDSGSKDGLSRRSKKRSREEVPLGDDETYFESGRKKRISTGGMNKDTTPRSPFRRPSRKKRPVPGTIAVETRFGTSTDLISRKALHETRVGSTKMVNLADTSLALPPRRHPAGKFSQASQTNALAIAHYSGTTKDRIFQSYKERYPKIPLEFGRDERYFNPYAVNPNQKGAILSKGLLQNSDKLRGKITDQIPFSLDDSSLDKMLAGNFGLNSLLTSHRPGSNVLDVARQIFQKIRCNRDTGNLMTFLHLSILRVYQYTVSDEEVFPAPEQEQQTLTTLSFG